MARIFLSLGSNLGDRLAHLRQALHRLTATGEMRFLDASPLYETEPWERQPGQNASRADWFLNCVVAIETSLAPASLLERIQETEQALGRTRPAGSPEAARYEPRTLDIDILLYDDQVISLPDTLQIPHLLMHERGFVLRPLADLAPQLEHPVLYHTIRELLDALEDDHEVIPSQFPVRWFEL